MNVRSLWVGLCLLGSVAAQLTLAADDASFTAVYSLTNDAASNGVMVYHRSADGTLIPVGVTATGGKGAGAGLGSQGALTASRGGQWLIGVNAGSNDVSVLRSTEQGLMAASVTPSGGLKPISVTISGRTVYVLNSGVPNDITGFTLGADGSLTAIPGSTRSLSGDDVGPAEVAFSPDGDYLAVTEKGTNLIDVFPVDPHGMAGARVTTASEGAVPFGFAFGKRNQVFVSEAAGGTASSYSIGSNGMLQAISASVPTGQAAACWLIVSADGRFAYTTNTGSRTVSLFSIDSAGHLTLIEGVAGSTPAGGSIDAAFSSGGRFLHVLTGNSASIVTFQVQPDGTLVEVGTVQGPPTAVGLVAQ